MGMLGSIMLSVGKSIVKLFFMYLSYKFLCLERNWKFTMKTPETIQKSEGFVALTATSIAPQPIEVH